MVDALSGGRLELGIGAGSDAAASRLFGRDHDLRHTDCCAAADQLCSWLDGPELVPAAPGLRRRLWWATGSRQGAEGAAERGMGLLSGRPGGGPGADVVADLARYRARVAGDPCVALSRIVQLGEPAADVLARWRGDPALAWGDELVAQTQPTDCGVAEQRDVMRMLVDDVVPALARDRAHAPPLEPAR